MGKGATGPRIFLATAKRGSTSHEVLPLLVHPRENHLNRPLPGPYPPVVTTLDQHGRIVFLINLYSPAGILKHSDAVLVIDLNGAGVGKFPLKIALVPA